MAKINVTKIKNSPIDSQQPLPSSMYSNYAKQIDPIRNDIQKKDYEKISVTKEQGKFYKLRKLILGPDVIPNTNIKLNSNLSQSQLRKIERQENYYRRIQSTINWGITRNDGDRRLRYMEYDRMEWMTPEVGRALDVLAADATTINQDGNVVTIQCSNEKLEEEVKFLFNEILDLNSNAFQYIRDTMKYGDSYYMIHMDAKKGIKKLVPLPVEHVDREVGFDENNPFAYRYRVASMGGDPLEPYEIAHFRLKTTMDFDEYGKSILENGRRIWRQLITLEDSMIIYRLVRAPQRRIFYFDIGNIRSDQIEAAVNKFANSFKKDRIYDQDGVVDYRLSLQPIHKDSSIPLLDGRTITIEELAREYEEGKENWVYSIDDKTHKNVPGKVKWCGRNFENAEILKVELDDGSYVLSHPSHPFILRDGSSLVAKDLQENMSLMPFYAKINKNGYEEVYDPGINKDVKTHTFVARDVYREEFRLLDENFNHTQNTVPIVHHKGVGSKNNSLNNSPTNLVPMTFLDHRILHSSVGRENLIKWNKTEENRQNTILYNKLLDKGRRMGSKYNGTDLHKEHNEIRREAQLKHWANGGHINPSIKFDSFIWNKLEEKFRSKEIYKQYDAINFLNNELMDYILEINKDCQKIQNTKKIERHAFNVIIKRELGCLYEEFRNNVLNEEKVLNHKVKSVSEWHERADVYCMTVVGPNDENDRHNFAVIPFDMNTEDHYNRYSGIRILNSIEEDYVIPKRGNQDGNKIDTLESQEWAAIDDVNYIHQKFITSLGVPNSYLGYEEALNSKCLHPDTLIPLLNGRELTIKQIADMFESGEIKENELEVYSYDVNSDSIIPGKITFAEKTRLDAQLVVVHLDNGESITSTPDHHFILRGGEEIEAQDLKEGDSLQACYRRKWHLGFGRETLYEQVYQPSKDKWVWTHKMVDNYYNGIIEKNGYDENGNFSNKNLTIIHHKDFNQFNNSSINLQRMGIYEHSAYHKDLVRKNIDNNPEWKDRLKNYMLERTPEERSEIALRGYQGEVGEKRREKTVELNKQRESYKDLARGYKEKFPDGRPDLQRENSVRWVERPSIEKIEEFAKSYTGQAKLVDMSKEMGYDWRVVQDAIRNSDYKTVPSFFNEHFGFIHQRAGETRLEYFKNISANVDSKEQFKNKFNVTEKRFNSILAYHKFNEESWNKELRGKCYNHKVVKVEWLEEKSDTYNMEVFDEQQNHNFLTSANIVCKNSTLGNEDIRYSQYVQRIQKSFLQELEKLMLIHLFVRGYKTYDITDIKISLTNPSHINELQELEIFQARLSAERDAKDSKSFSSYWIKKNVWKMTDQDIEDEENQLIRDSIRNFVFAQGETGVFLTVKDVLDYNSIEAQAAKEAGGGGMDEGGLGGGGGGMPGLDGGMGGGDMGGGDMGGMEEPPSPDLDLNDVEAPDTLVSPDEINQDIEDNNA